jgi:hypothetical protein
MSWLTENQRLVGRCAWVAAWLGLVVGGRFRTSCTRAGQGAAGRDDLVRHDRRSASWVQRLWGRS